MAKDKFMLTVVLITTMLFTLSGCYGGKKEQVSGYSSGFAVPKYSDLVYLSDWKEDDARSFETHPVLAEAIKNYEKSNNSKITFAYSPYSEKQGKLAAMLAAGTPPDVYQPIDGFPQFSFNNYAQPIDNLINLKDPIWKGVKDAYDATEWEGKHNFVVINKGAQDVVWYNKILFKKNGLDTPYDLYKRGDWNWDTFRELAIKLNQDTDGDRVIDQWGMSSGPESIIATTGNDLVKINGKAGTIENNLKNPDVINALKFFQEAGSSKYNIIQPDLNGYMTDFAKGKVAMCMGAIWSDNVWWTEMMKKGECSFVPAPRYPNLYEYYVRGDAEIWMIPKESQNPKASAVFLTELRKAQIDPQVQRVIDESNIKNRGWTAQEIEMTQELQKLKYTYTFFSSVGNIGNDRWNFWGSLRVAGTPVETEIEKHYTLWNNEIDIVTGRIKLEHNEITAAAGTPKIDGEIDDVWKNVMEITTDEEKTSADIATAKVKLLYDTDTLYVLARVSDKSIMTDNKKPWECDSVEIFVDENKYNLNGYDSNTVQLIVGADGKMTGAGPAWDKREDALTSAVKRVNGGYIIEAAYKFKEIKAKAGDSIGFNVHVNDEEETGSRKGTSVWNPDQGSSYFNPSRFGIVNFQ
jgi:ABC-type glycerol-3-phosphate transport system substrate-binding protein